VRDLWGASPTVDTELWRYLIGIDLVLQWQAGERPVDEPVRRAMHDSRAYESKARFDDQWLRILDVDAALRTRTYAPGDAVKVGVDDPMFASNCGVWSISANGAFRVDAPADVRVDIGTLSAAYLGAVSWRDLASIGSVAATDEVLALLDTLFAVRPTPFCGSGY
jgi:predicted acetyltransferase